jgi:hypothetical protein
MAGLRVKTIVILSEAKNLWPNSSFRAEVTSEMFRFAQHDNHSSHAGASNRADH